MALIWKTLGTTSVVTSTTAVQIQASSELCYDIQIQAAAANEGEVYIGLSDVSPTEMIISLSAGEVWNASGSISGPAAGEFDISDYWVEAANNNEDIMVSIVVNKKRT